MFSIGDFARLGLVSVRMLRHYDAIGLLPPAHVDDVTGYRRYAADQLPRLNRIVALAKLGFTLKQVAELLDDAVSAEQLHELARSGLSVSGPGIAYYEDVEDGVLVHAAVAVSGAITGDVELALVDLPGMELAATTLHHGPMSESGPVYDEMARWLDENGYRSGQYAREVSLHCPPGVEQRGWITEFQLPVARN
jgi:DNA-binding transcriptional MerR regulator